MNSDTRIAHTPGPWHAKPFASPPNTFYITDNSGKLAFGAGRSILEADAHLIASAPDLLAALQAIQHNAAVMNQAEPNAVWSAIDDMCQAAIRKATGGDA